LLAQTRAGLGIRVEQKAADVIDRGQASGRIAANGRPRKDDIMSSFYRELGIDGKQVERWRKLKAIAEDPTSAPAWGEHLQRGRKSSGVKLRKNSEKFYGTILNFSAILLVSQGQTWYT
jgi:hypothetical protein